VERRCLARVQAAGKQVVPIVPDVGR